MGKNYLSKLGLGTVQFGLDYGVSNQNGKMLFDDVKEILNIASINKIKTIDTAFSYGNSEKVLGEATLDPTSFDIVTKTIPIKKNIIQIEDIKKVEEGFYNSLKKLNKRKIYGFLVHHADDLMSENANQLFDCLSRLRDTGIVHKVGVSVYDQEQIDFILERFKIDLIQLPMNIFDQRLFKTKTLQKLKDHDVEIHVRSAFMQGLVFLEKNELPQGLKDFSPYLEQFCQFARELNSTRSAVALAFLMQQDTIDKVICGVHNPKQFKTIINDVSSLPEIDNKLFSSFAIDDVRMVNPAFWNI